MKVKKDSHQGAIAFLSEEGTDDETSDEAEEEAAADALAAASEERKPRSRWQ